MKIASAENPELDSDITASEKDYVAGGSWNSDTPASTYLTLDMNMEKLVCDDARTFKCVLSYDNSQTTERVSKYATFSAYGKFILSDYSSLHILVCGHSYSRGDYE
jgi:hypothetical protein